MLRAAHSGLLANELFISIGKKSSVPVIDKVSSAQETVPPPVADDPYKRFLAEQNAWELQLDADRAAKRAKLHSAERANVAEQKASGVETDQAAKRAKLHTDGAEQRGSEAEMDRTANRAKLQAEIPDVTTLRKQLEAKTAECQSLNSKLNQMESEIMAQEQLSKVCTLRPGLNVAFYMLRIELPN